MIKAVHILTYEQQIFATTTNQFRHKS